MRALALTMFLCATSMAAGPDPKAALAVLASDADPHAKAVACQQLAITGGPEAVPALAGLLGHEQLSDYARSALERIAHPSAGAALRDALPKLKGRLLAGAVASLGVRRDTAAVPALLEIVRDPARGAAGPAIAALGQIGNEEAAAALRATMTDGPADLRVPAAHAALVAAGHLARDGQREAALALFDGVSAAALPEHVRAAASNQAAGLRGDATGPARAARPLFDGKSLDGWEGDPAWFRVEEGAMVAGTLAKPIPQNEFLCTTRDFGDFELRLKVRLADGKGNGGIQFRSQRVPGNREMSGYQADVGEAYWGGLYDESRRAKFLGQAPDPAAFAKFVKANDWNEYVIRCEGPRVRLWLNGQLTVDFTETEAAIPRTGKVGLQIHSGPPCEARYKDIEIKELPPVAK